MWLAIEPTSRRGPQRSEDTRRERRSWPLTLIEPDSVVGCYGCECPVPGDARQFRAR
jgi:hypothetical protein